MDVINQYSTDHWWMFFWLCTWALIVAWRIFATCACFANRVLRSINVALRGWPPVHLDADGDWKPTPADDDSGSSKP
jgi:hypothetical protein